MASPTVAELSRSPQNEKRGETLGVTTPAASNQLALANLVTAPAPQAETSLLSVVERESAARPRSGSWVAETIRTLSCERRRRPTSTASDGQIGPLATVSRASGTEQRNYRFMPDVLRALGSGTTSPMGGPNGGVVFD